MSFFRVGSESAPSGHNPDTVFSLLERPGVLFTAGSGGAVLSGEGRSIFGNLNFRAKPKPS